MTFDVSFVEESHNFLALCLIRIFSVVYLQVKSNILLWFAYKIELKDKNKTVEKLVYIKLEMNNLSTQFTLKL